MQTKELAGVVIYNERGELLLIHRNTPTLVQWELPGGKVEKGESVQETAIRESREEIGVEVKLGEIIGSASFEHRDINWNYTWLQAEIADGREAIINEPESFDEIAYFAIDDLRKTTDISPNVVNLLQVIGQK